MTQYLGDNIRADLAILAMGGATAGPGQTTFNCSTAGVFSKCFSLVGVDRVMILCGQGNSTGVALVPSQFKVMVGKYDAGGASALSSLASASIRLGATSSAGGGGSTGAWNNDGLVELMVHCDATAAVDVGDTLAFDGTTFTFAGTGTVADKTLSTGNIAFMNQFVSAIATHCTHLEVAGIVTATTDTRCVVRPKDLGFAGGQTTGMGGTASTNATTGEVELIGQKYQGVIEFTPNDVLATNSSYTHFGIKLNTTVTTAIMTAWVIRTGGMNATNTKSARL